MNQNCLRKLKTTLFIINRWKAGPGYALLPHASETLEHAQNSLLIGVVALKYFDRI